VTKIGFRRGTFLRGFMCDFIERFAPHLTRRIQMQLMNCRSKDEQNALFAHIELPTL